MDLRRLLMIGRRWVALPLIGAVLAGIIAFAFINAQPRLYEASATLKLGQAVSGSPILLSQVSDRLLTEYAYRATTQDTLQAAIERLDLDTTVTDLRRQVSAGFEADSALLTITALADDADGVAELANAVGSALIELGQVSQGDAKVQQSLLADLDALRSQIDSSRTRIAELSAEESSSQATRNQIAQLEDQLVSLIAAYGDVLDRMLSIGAHELEFVAAATPPDASIEPRPVLFAALAAIAVLLLLFGLAAAVEYFDDRVRFPEDVEAATGLPTLGILSEPRRDARAGGEQRLVMLRDPRSPSAEEYRRVRAKIDPTLKAANQQSLVVTGTNPPIGKSVVAANLAIAFAETGRRVVLVDADLRRPEMHTFFGLPNDRGLSSLLAFPSTPLSYMCAGTRVPGLWVLPAGRLPEVPGSLGPERIEPLTERLLSEYDLLIFDSPEVPSASDALTLISSARHTLLVVTEKQTSRRTLREALDAINVAKADVVGIALFGWRKALRGRVGRPVSMSPQAALPATADPAASQHGRSDLPSATPNPNDTSAAGRDTT